MENTQPFVPMTLPYECTPLKFVDRHALHTFHVTHLMDYLEILVIECRQLTSCLDAMFNEHVGTDAWHAHVKMHDDAYREKRYVREQLRNRTQR